MHIPDGQIPGQWGHHYHSVACLLLSGPRRGCCTLSLVYCAPSVLRPGFPDINVTYSCAQVVIKNDLSHFMCMGVGLHVCMHTMCMPVTLRRQKKALESQTATTRMLRTELS